MAEKRRVVIIGLDGVPLTMLRDFAESGVMANTAELMGESFLTQMRSSVPEISSVAWSSIITGAGPAEHGIFGFTDTQPDSYKLRFPNFNDLKVAPFWRECPGKSVIINVPSTYPVRDMNGVHISGFVSIDINRSVHPTFLAGKLKGLDYRLDVASEKAHSDLGLFLEDLDETLTARIKAIEYLWDYVDWRVFMPTFTGTDRLMHFLFEAYENKGHRHHNDFVNHFRRIDAAIGSIRSKLSENDVVIMLSDHGFEELEKDVYINQLLTAEGLLSFRPGSERKPENIDPATRAFVMDPARIYLNRKGKYPAGSVEPGNEESCLSEVQSLFESFEIEGRKVIKYIFRKQNIYSGPYLDKAPDLVLVPEKGFNLKGSMTATELVGKGPFTGKHTYEGAFLLINDKSLASDLPDDPNVTDAGKVIKSLVSS